MRHLYSVTGNSLSVVTCVVIESETEGQAGDCWMR